MERLKKWEAIIILSLFFAAMIAPAYAAQGKVNINTAAKQELMTLKNVGESIADRIIEYRAKTPFEVPEDIMKVKGVGQKTFDANKDRICCTD